jgi:DNA repair protein RecO (recombination protein O)
LGFYPDISDTNQMYLNLNKGLFESSLEGVYSISGENLTILKQLLGTNFDTLEKIKLNSKQRQSFLSVLLLYFELHLGSFKKPNSLKVFNQVFN